MMAEVFRLPAVRLTMIFGGTFLLCTLLIFGFVYWRTGVYETQEVDRFLVLQAQRLAEGGAHRLLHLSASAGMPGRSWVAFEGVFGPDLKPLEGNLLRFPPNLAIDGRAHRVRIPASEEDSAEAGTVRAVALRLLDGRILVIARNVDEIEDLQSVILEALALGAIPAIGLSLTVGAGLSRRALWRVRMVRRAAERITAGDLRERLVSRGSNDDFDRLAASVNRMLDEIERLLDEVKGVGDSIAHDLRTPLTRVRTRLERGRDSARSKEELEATIGSAIASLDQALAIITALLRIAELEDKRRRTAFQEVDLDPLASEVAEFFGPIAEQKQIVLTVEAGSSHLVFGDRELLIEALANVIDNAIKFVPESGEVLVSVLEGEKGPIIRVADSGPGIPVEQREAVLKRFFRSDKSRHLPGSGLGLALVAAIVKLHGFRIAIGDAEPGPGCVFDIVCCREQD
jgi:signal transduction histidine kinase